MEHNCTQLIVVTGLKMIIIAVDEYRWQYRLPTYDKIQTFMKINKICETQRL